MANRPAYIDKLSAQLKEWDAEIAKLEAKAQKAQADSRIEYNQRIWELQNKKKAAQTKLEEVKRAGDEAWQELKAGTDEVFDDMRKTFDSVLSKFK
jgi:chromosome segregation ATPase